MSAVKRHLIRSRAVRVCCVSLFVSACCISSTATADDKIYKLVDDLSIKKAFLIDNLTVWPVYSTQPMEKLEKDFISLSEAQANKNVVIREVGKSSETIPNREERRRRQRPTPIQNHLSNRIPVQSALVRERAIK